VRRFRKTVSVGADVTSDGSVPKAAAGHRKRTITDSGQRCTSDRQLHGRRPETAPVRSSLFIGNSVVVDDG